MTTPWSPTYCFQPMGVAASIETRARISGGRTLSRYSAGWASNSSQEGRETTRAIMSFSCNICPASRAMCTSEPVPMRITSGFSVASQRT